MLGQALALGGVADAEWGSRAIAVFGHRAYVGVSVNMVAASQLPGWDQDAVARNALVDQPQVGDPLPFGEPAWTAGALGSVAKAVAAGRSVALLRHLRADTRAYCAAAEAEHLDAAQLALLPEAALEVRLRLLRDRIHQGWILNALWLIDTGVTAAAAAQPGGAQRARDQHDHRQRTRRGGDGRAGVGAAGRPAVARAGRRGQPREHSCAVAEDRRHCGRGRRTNRAPRSGRGRAGQQDLRRRPDDVADRRGRGRTPEPTPATLAERLTANARGSRELAHDTTMRFTHELRMTLRALGSLRVEADLIDAVDDMYYLTCNELVTMPGDARLRIKRRRTERERLQAQFPPDVIDGAWAPVPHSPDDSGAGTTAEDGSAEQLAQG